MLFFAPWILAQLLFAPGEAPGSRVVPHAAVVVTATPELQVRIDAPQSGDALQGVVSISGSTGLAGFRSAEVAFAYQSDPTGTWFILQQSNTPVQEGSLATWDTTTITDGEYQLRVQVFLQEGLVVEKTLTGLRVRNYTPVETSTPEARSAGEDTPTPTATPRPDFQAKPSLATPLPTNPAQITPQHLEMSAVQGVLVVLGASLAAAIYLGLRAIARH